MTEEASKPVHMTMILQGACQWRAARNLREQGTDLGRIGRDKSRLILYKILPRLFEYRPSATEYWEKGSLWYVFRGFMSRLREKMHNGETQDQTWKVFKGCLTRLVSTAYDSGCCCSFTCSICLGHGIPKLHNWQGGQSSTNTARAVR